MAFFSDSYFPQFMCSFNEHLLALSLYQRLLLGVLIQKLKNANYVSMQKNT